MSYRVGDDVAWLEPPGTETDPDASDPLAVVVARLPDGPPVSLVGSSAAIWLAAVEGGDAARVRDRVATMAGVDAGAIADDVESFLGDLVARGFLVDE